MTPLEASFPASLQQYRKCKSFVPSPDTVWNDKNEEWKFLEEKMYVWKVQAVRGSLKEIHRSKAFPHYGTYPIIDIASKKLVKKPRL